jgi:hypothetical protein
MKFDGTVTDIKTDNGYSRGPQLRVEVDLNEGIGKERAVFLLYLPKDHTEGLDYLAAWQAGRRLVVSVELV